MTFARFQVPHGSHKVEPDFQRLSKPRGISSKTVLRIPCEISFNTGFDSILDFILNFRDHPEKTRVSCCSSEIIDF